MYLVYSLRQSNKSELRIRTAAIFQPNMTNHIPKWRTTADGLIEYNVRHCELRKCQTGNIVIFIGNESIAFSE